MNWKTLFLIAGIILTASLAACSNTPTSTNQSVPSSSPAAAMKQGDAMKQDGDAMKK